MKLFFIFFAQCETRAPNVTHGWPIIKVNSTNAHEQYLNWVLMKYKYIFTIHYIASDPAVFSRYCGFGNIKRETRIEFSDTL